MSEEKAAEKIQASFRGYKTRKSLKNNGALPGQKEEPIPEVDESEKKPSEQENASKPNSAQADLPDELLDIDLTDKDLEKAATKIQNTYRNFTAKKKPVKVDPPAEEKIEKKSEEPTVNDKVENGESSWILKAFQSTFSFTFTPFISKIQSLPDNMSAMDFHPSRLCDR
ncbi:hypothetical protein CDAR_102431 [Caerostris darwini]|uniref:Uncharacterized protein n=1 Tax=Caerostris darwini TaxID=1538125 RepID=A0AAV4QJP6_9ARAC|nr:hypothetical protein CDAR_102431 [Caerostris darwini]